MISLKLGLLFVSWICFCIVQAGQPCTSQSQCPKGQNCLFPEDKQPGMILLPNNYLPIKRGECHFYGKCSRDKDCDPGFQCMAKVHIPAEKVIFGECEKVPKAEEPVEPRKCGFEFGPCSWRELCVDG